MPLRVSLNLSSRPLGCALAQAEAEGPTFLQRSVYCIDALTDQIRTEMDQEKRKALCSEAQKILADDLPYLPL